jgi:hypothetical protein
MASCRTVPADGAPEDFDCDTRPDYLDTDSDNDGVSDKDERDPMDRSLPGSIG